MKDDSPNANARPAGYTAGVSQRELQSRYSVTDITKLGSNENPLGPAPAVVKAIRDAAADVNRYPPVHDNELREVIALALTEASGQPVDAQNIVTGNGGAEVLSLIARAWLNPDSECIICRPTFPVYEMVAARQQARIVYADLKPNDFVLDVDAILAAVTEHTRVVFVCNPNNPTGNLAGDMERLLRSLPEHVLLVADEVYHHFAADAQQLKSVVHALKAPNVLVLHSFSKGFGMAGCRLGYAVGSTQAVRPVAAHRLPFHLNAVTTAAGLAALGDRDYLDRTVTLVRTGRAWLFDELRAFGVRVWPSEANFLLFKTTQPASQVAERMLQRGVIIRSLEGFSLPEHLRVTIGLPEENRRFVESLTDVLSELNLER